MTEDPAAEASVQQTAIVGVEGATERLWHLVSRLVADYEPTREDVATIVTKLVSAIAQERDEWKRRACCPHGTPWDTNCAKCDAANKTFFQAIHDASHAPSPGVEAVAIAAKAAEEAAMCVGEMDIDGKKILPPSYLASVREHLEPIIRVAIDASHAPLAERADDLGRQLAQMTKLRNDGLDGAFRAEDALKAKLAAAGQPANEEDGA